MVVSAHTTPANMELSISQAQRIWENRPGRRCSDHAKQKRADATGHQKLTTELSDSKYLRAMATTLSNDFNHLRIGHLVVEIITLLPTK